MSAQQSDRRRLFAMNRSSNHSSRHQYGRPVDDPQPQAHPRAQPSSNYAHNWQHQQSSSAGSIHTNQRYASQRVPASSGHHHHHRAAQHHQQQQQQQQQATTSHKRSSAASILDKWFTFGLNNRNTDRVCERCGDGGHHGEECPKNRMRCQYCSREVDYKDLCDHQLNCPERTRQCHTCGHSYSLPDFFAHASACRVAYTKSEKLSSRIRNDGMIGA